MVGVGDEARSQPEVEQICADLGRIRPENREKVNRKVKNREEADEESEEVGVGLSSDEDLKDVADGVGGEDGVVDGDGSSADVRESTS